MVHRFDLKIDMSGDSETSPDAHTRELYHRLFDFYDAMYEPGGGREEANRTHERAEVDMEAWRRHRKACQLTGQEAVSLALSPGAAMRG
jgi:hypothetical protein